jgi:ABC-type phosphate transport system substrate-binding protein
MRGNDVRGVKLPGLRNTTRGIRALVAVVLSTLTGLSAGILTPGQPALAATFVPISGAGSTWSFNAINISSINESEIGMKVNYQPVGSASGRDEYTNGTVDWAASDIPYGVPDGTSPNSPPPTRGYTYVPDTAGGIAFMYNLHIGGRQVTNLRLSGAAIAGIFTNKITMWNDPQIAADNPGLALPTEPIVPVVRTDSSASTWQFTQWLSATQSADWTAYCAVVTRSPCTQTTGYPVQSGTPMVGQQGDLGVAGYVAQATAEGAIGYTEYSYALETGFPVAKVLNAAGYYTAPTAANVGVSLLNAQIDNNPSDLLYQTEELSNVYTDTDPRTYELSYYSYMIVPTDLTSPMNIDKGYTLGTFGAYLLCQGQVQLDALGYAALPINLVQAGYSQLQRIPGSTLTATAAAFLQSCADPTMSNGSDILASGAPMPRSCDQQGPIQCAPGQAAGTIPVDIAVPQTGSLTVTVSTTAVINLAVQGTSPPLTATGTLNSVVVSDTRNYVPGWSVSGQASGFTGSGTVAGSTIPADQLGWVPTGAVASGGTLGPAVAPGSSPGLGDTAQVLASATPGNGFGTSTLGANLTLDIPETAPPGTYTSTLTITYVEAGP